MLSGAAFAGALGSFILLLAQGHIATWYLPSILVGIFILALVIASFYLIACSTLVVVRNMICMHDKKPLVGFSGFFVSRSVILSGFLQMFGFSWILTPGYLYIIMQFGYNSEALYQNPQIVNFVSGDFGYLSLLIFPVGLYLAARLILSILIALDTNLSAIGSMKKSWAITGKHQWLFVANNTLYLMCGLIPFLTVIFALPFLFTHIYLYKKLK